MPSDPEAPKGNGFFAKLKARLGRSRTLLTGDLFGLFRRGIDEEALEEFEERLLTADVGVEVTEWLIERLRKASKRAGTSSEAAVAALRSALMELLEPVEQPLEIDAGRKPFVVLMIGVNGTGKTTTIGKLAHRLKREGRSVLLAAGDTFRAAAVEQLQEWGARAKIGVVAQAAGADPAAVVHDALYAARARGTDVLLADTAGRLHTSAGLMDELEKIKRVVTRFDAGAPHEVLLVLDASQGQNALAQARQFHERLGVTGLVITKLDGTAKGGVLLSIAKEIGVPIRYVAVGEGIDDLDVFRADEFVNALLGDRAR
ncbi:MAG TPA: signal recognition particle-docking protein FtsY [Gammaproteobacteria bacterium]|nr:signal recognition particle-docking protein FtsY [Gammaproteobacteria bacterium]